MSIDKSRFLARQTRPSWSRKGGFKPKVWFHSDRHPIQRCSRVDPSEAGRSAGVQHHPEGGALAGVHPGLGVPSVPARLRTDVVPPLRVPPGGNHPHLRLGPGADTAFGVHGREVMLVLADILHTTQQIERRSGSSGPLQRPYPQNLAGVADWWCAHDSRLIWSNCACSTAMLGGCLSHKSNLLRVVRAGRVDGVYRSAGLEHHRHRAALHQDRPPARAGEPYECRGGQLEGL